MSLAMDNSLDDEAQPMGPFRDSLRHRIEPFPGHPQPDTPSFTEIDALTPPDQPDLHCLDSEPLLLSSVARQRADGTMTFRPPTDPINDDRSRWYRHDLESLFYTLIWWAVHYDSRKNRDCPFEFKVNPGLKGWTYESRSQNSTAKSMFILANKGQALLRAIWGPDGSELSEVVHDCIWPLYSLFVGVRLPLLLDPDDDEVDINNYDLETSGGRLTFDTFMKAIDARGILRSEWVVDSA